MTLYIIGNGFDIKHGIPSRYSDFAKFVANRNYALFKQIENCLLNLSPNGLWSNFEEALGTQNLEVLLKDYRRNEKEKRDNPIGIDNYELKSAMRDWTISLKRYIKHCVSVPKFAFGERSCFLSFNYTNTLEAVYGISKNICHIHEYVDSIEETTAETFVGYIFGHGREKTDLIEYGDFEIKETIAAFKKEYQLTKLEENCKDIVFSDIIVLGHSLGLVDKPYFSFLKEQYPSANWHIGYFDDEDLVNKINHCHKLEINTPLFFQDN